MTDPRFTRCFFVVAAVHAALIFVIIVCPEVWRLFRKPKPLIVPVEFLVEVPGSPEPPGTEVRSEPSPPEPKPEIPKPKPPTPRPPKEDKPKPPEPKPEPDAASAKPKPEPKPDAVKPGPVKVERSTTKVKRTLTRYSAKPQASKLTAEQIQKLLDMGAKPSDRTQIPDEDSRGLDLIRRTLYEAWVQPEMPVAASPVAEVELVLDRTGGIRSWRILKGSGSAEFDASVRAALQQVSRINGLTSSFLDRFSRVTVAFRLE